MGNIKNNTYLAIGLMSGTSLDGLDIVIAKFTKKEDLWNYDVLDSKCIIYGASSKNKLKKANTLTPSELSLLDADYGKWIGNAVNDFLTNLGITDKVDVIGSHGHTVLHDPKNGFTLQIGNGAIIAETTKIDVVCDLRSSDVAAGGQGAPIVPIGEKMLFSDNNAFLNIGGIANVSFHDQNEIIAYDICPANTPLNKLIQELGFEMDKDGMFARKGKIDKALLKALDKFKFYKQKAPKSLHTDIILKEFMPIVTKSKEVIADKLATVCEHIALKIGEAIDEQTKINNINKLLVTGGGALNTFLIERIRANTDIEIEVANENIVNYKEALIMAFFAVLRLRKETNCISSVTGANKDVIGGALYLG